jgi:hypothetical protein
MRLFRPLVPVAAVLTLAVVPGCAHHEDGPVTTQVRYPTTAQTPATPTTGEFSRIDLRGPVDVVVHEGAATSVSVTGGPRAQARVQTHVEGDTLIVDLANGPEDGCFGVCIHTGEEDARVTVALPAFRAGTIEGSGDLTVEASGAHPEVDFDVRGSGDVRYTGNADILRCTIDGSGDVVLRGAGKRLEARVHGSGDVRAREFPVEGGVYEIDGSGDIATVVHGGDMTVHINGSGDLLYGGEARITSLDVSGSGSVRQLGGSRED